MIVDQTSDGGRCSGGSCGRTGVDSGGVGGGDEGGSSGGAGSRPLAIDPVSGLRCGHNSIVVVVLYFMMSS